MSNSLYNALGGGMPAQVPQQPTPSPAPAGALGGGSIFQALAQTPMQNAGPQPAKLGPMVADNSGLMQGNPFFNPDKQKGVQPAAYTPPQPEPTPKPSNDLAATAAGFFNRMKGQ